MHKLDCMNRKITAITAFMLLFVVVFTQLRFNLFRSALGGAFADELPETKVVYLTFDDGPSDKVTPKILDVLKEENVRATFFIVGRQAETRQYVLRRAANEGHTIAVHSYTHIYKDIYASEESLAEDVEKCNTVIRRVTGKEAEVYRFPGGSFSVRRELVDKVESLGLKHIDWNASFCDAEIVDASPEQLAEAAIRTAAGRSRVVMLAHDSTDKSATAQALPTVIRYFKENGYSFSAF